MKKNNKQELKRLQKIWYQKLADAGYPELAQSGFEDMKDEYRVSKLVKVYEPEKIEHTQRYYELAAQLLHTFPFTSKESKAIWKRHADGENDRDIARALKITVQTVRKSINYVASHIKDV